MLRARIAGHPLHPALAHFPIGLWFTAVLWDVVGWWQTDLLWYQISYWCLAIGLIVALFTITTGFLEYLAIPPKDPAMNTATAHMMLMATATAVFGTSWVLRTISGWESAPTLWAIILTLIGAGLLGIGGWLGGMLVYRHGIGRL